MLNTLAGVVGVDHVRPWSGSTIDDMSPEIVVAPANADEVAKVLQLASNKGWSVTPLGTGTALNVGNPPAATAIAVSLERMRQLVSYDPDDLTAVAEGGCLLGTLNATLGENGQCLPLDPPGGDKITIGGMVAVGAAGPLRQAYGTPRDWVLGLHIVTSEGKLLKLGGRVVKNVAGYDMIKLHVGGLGTLGIVVEVCLKVYPKPETELTVVVSSQSRSALLELSHTYLKSGLAPISLELLSAQGVRLCGVSVSGMENYLFARFAGLEVDVRHQVLRAEKTAVEAGVEVDTQIGQEYVSEFWNLRSELMNRSELPLVLCARVFPGRMDSVIDCFESSLGCFADELVVAVSSGVGTGFLTAEGWRLADNIDAVIEGIKAVRAACTESGGSLILWRAPTSIKSQIDVWGDVGAAFPLMKRLKNGLDPKGILNPGRFVGGL